MAEHIQQVPEQAEQIELNPEEQAALDYEQQAMEGAVLAGRAQYLANRVADLARENVALRQRITELESDG